MEPRLDRTPPSKSLAGSTWTVAATTVPAIDPIASPPDLGDDIAQVFSPSPSYQVTNSSNQTTTVYTCFGLTASGPWAATGAAQGSSSSNSGCSLPAHCPGRHPLDERPFHDQDEQENRSRVVAAVSRVGATVTPDSRPAIG